MLKDDNLSDILDKKLEDLLIDKRNSIVKILDLRDCAKFRTDEFKLTYEYLKIPKETRLNSDKINKYTPSILFILIFSFLFLFINEHSRPALIKVTIVSGILTLIIQILYFRSKRFKQSLIITHDGINYLGSSYRWSDIQNTYLVNFNYGLEYKDDVTFLVLGLKNLKLIDLDISGIFDSIDKYKSVKDRIEKLSKLIESYKLNNKICT